MTRGEPNIRRWRVSGRVQGVNFRYSTRREALRLGLEDGWANNLADGDVEVCARGEEQALAALEQWLWRGPALAAVSDVRPLPPPRDVPRGFTTG